MSCCTASCNTIESHIDTTQYNFLCVQNSDLRPLPYVTTTADNNCMSSPEEALQVHCMYIRGHVHRLQSPQFLRWIVVCHVIGTDDRNRKGRFMKRLKIYWLYIADIGLSRHYLMCALYN